MGGGSRTHKRCIHYPFLSDEVEARWNTPTYTIYTRLQHGHYHQTKQKINCVAN